MRLVAPLLAIWVLGCSGKSGEDTAADDGGSDEGTSDSDTDTDTDADTDSDADADSDTDTDTATDTGEVRTEPADLSGCVSIDETDEEDDGTIERTSTSTYDAQGLLVSFLVDDDDPDSAVTTTFVRDGVGNELERQFDNDGDGTVDDVHFRTWTATNELETYCVDYGDDGTCDYAERITYDPTSGLRSLYEQDGDGDAVYESSCTYTYDGTDRRLSYLCDGPLDRSAAYTYTGGTIWDYDLALDVGADGSDDVLYEYRFDAAGRQIRAATDTNTNGVWDSEADTLYNPDGTVSQIDGATVGPASTFRYTYTYDVEGYLTDSLFGIDVTGDGLPDSVTVDTFTWQCN